RHTEKGSSMLGKGLLATMFDYNAGTDARLLDCAARVSDAQLDAPTGYSVGSLRQTLWHTLIVAYGWRSQCQGVDARALPFPVEPTATIAAFQTFQQEEAARVQAFVAAASEDDLAGRVTLKRPDGTERSLTQWQILTHILYHSAQHRSEMAELLTRYGQSLGDTDFLFFVMPKV
ncbi:MAG: DinB family protein, partial [Thermomicrobia bacterium]|nr:DinB family protein [Thermomicrobia bacterium]